MAAIKADKDEDHHHEMKKMNNFRVNFQSSQLQFGERELEVSEILLNLPYLFTNCLTNFRFSLSWGSKRRRSVLDHPPSPVKPITKPPEATSPDTPLSFCPSECEAKSKQSTTKKTSVKRTREELLRVIEDRKENQQTLMQEIGKVKLHLQKLQDENSELKAKKHKLNHSTVEMRRENAQLEVCDGLNPVTEFPQPQLQQHNDCVPSGPSTSTVYQHQPPLIPHHQGGLIINPTIQGFHGGQVQVQVQLNYNQQLGPRGFDLNVPAEETERAVQLQPLDQHQIFMMNFMRTRVYTEQARAARHHRIRQNKAKKALRGT